MKQTNTASMESSQNQIKNKNFQEPSIGNTYPQYHSQSRNNFSSQLSNPPHTFINHQQQFPNYSQFTPYEYLQNQPSANNYFPTAGSDNPYSYNHASYSMLTYPFPYQSDGSYYSPYFQQGP